MTRLGKALVTDAELVSTEETIRRVRAVTEADVAAAARELFAPERLSAAGIGPRESRFRAARRARQPGARRAVVRVCLFGAGGKVGSVLGPALERAGHDVVDGRADGPGGCDVAVDFTRPDAVLGERRPVPRGSGSRS